MSGLLDFQAQWHLLHLRPCSSDPSRQDQEDRTGLMGMPARIKAERDPAEGHEKQQEEERTLVVFFLKKKTKARILVLFILF